MQGSQQFAPQSISLERIAGLFRRMGSAILVLLGIAVSTAAAFVALIWLDGSLRYVTAIATAGRDLRGMPTAAASEQHVDDASSGRKADWTSENIEPRFGSVAR